jgi:hypothetical protein
MFGQVVDAETDGSEGFTTLQVRRNQTAALPVIT